jgi:hypothetical protein
MKNGGRAVWTAASRARIARSLLNAAKRRIHEEGAFVHGESQQEAEIEEEMR